MPRTHKLYEEEFKRQAVELSLSSGKSRKQVARELGVSDGSLRKWHKDFDLAGLLNVVTVSDFLNQRYAQLKEDNI